MESVVRFIKSVGYGLTTPTTWFKGAAIAVTLLALGTALWIAYSQNWEWTGFPAFTDPKGEYSRTKTLWDWLDLLIVPAVLAVGAFWLSQTEKKTELHRTLSQQRENALQKYLDEITTLLLEHKLEEDEQVSLQQKIATARTLTVLAELDGKRKRSVLRFLIDAQLVVRRPHDGGLNYLIPIIDLKGADLTNADLHGMNLSDVLFEGVDLRGADLKGVNLQDLTTDGLTQMDEKWRLVHQLVNIPYTVPKDRLRSKDLRGANLRGTDLRDYDLRGTDLREANLEHVRLKGSRLTKSTRIDPKWYMVWKMVNERMTSKEKKGLNSADLSGAFLVAVDLRNAILAGANLRAAYMEAVRLQGADLSGADLSLARLSRSHLDGANLSRAFMYEVELDDADLPNANLSRAWIWGGTLRKANFSSANLQGASLMNVELQDANLTDANLRDADLATASLTGARIDNAHYNTKTKFPQDFDPSAAGMTFHDEPVGS